MRYLRFSTVNVPQKARRKTSACTAAGCLPSIASLLLVNWSMRAIELRESVRCPLRARVSVMRPGT